MQKMTELNALGEILEPCSLDPMTGYYRTGLCQCGPKNEGIHTVCIYATEEFLNYSKKVGNDLSTAMPQYNFPGVKVGESWCLNGPSFVKALSEEIDVKIFIHSTHINILKLIDLNTLKKCAIDL